VVSGAVGSATCSFRLLVPEKTEVKYVNGYLEFPELWALPGVYVLRRWEDVEALGPDTDAGSHRWERRGVYIGEAQNLSQRMAQYHAASLTNCQKRGIEDLIKAKRVRGHHERRVAWWIQAFYGEKNQPDRRMTLDLVVWAVQGGLDALKAGDFDFMLRNSLARRYLEGVVIFSDFIQDGLQDGVDEIFNFNVTSLEDL
jgi:hypothetical protein